MHCIVFCYCQPQFFSLQKYTKTQANTLRGEYFGRYRIRLWFVEWLTLVTRFEFHIDASILYIWEQNDDCDFASLYACQPVFIFKSVGISVGCWLQSLGCISLTIGYLVVCLRFCCCCCCSCCCCLFDFNTVL